jgi:hypothetical protein
MRTTWRSLRPYLVLAVLGGALIWPLLRADVPCTDDGAFYYYQAVALRHSLRQGVLYSRWMPDAALGYGLPFFNYREPLTRYLVLDLLMAGFNGPLALNLAFALGVLVGGWGVFRLTRDVFGSEVAGIGAGVAAMASPYMMLIFYRRGALAESYALVLLPWVLWAMWRCARDGGSWPVVRAALIGALFALCHNISTMLALPVVGGYALLAGWAARNGDRRQRLRAWMRCAGSYGGGLGMAAFFLIPAFVERDLVRTSALTSTRNNSYFYNFVAPGEVFAPAGPHNPAWLNPSMTIHIGPVLALLALAGLVGGWMAYRDRARRGHLVSFALLAVGYTVMVFPASRPVWDAVPLLAFVQFPWRLIGQASLVMAVLAGVAVGVGVEWLAARLGAWAEPVTVGVAAVVLIAMGLAGTYPVGWCRLPAQPTINDVHAFELGYHPGLDDVGSLFPAEAPLPNNSPLPDDYRIGRQPQRFDASAAPPGAKIDAQIGPLGADITINTPEAFRARYLVYVFPGWEVQSEGHSVPVTPEPETGLITFEVPAGVSRWRVRFGPTAVRLWVTVVSAICAVGAGLLLIAGRGEKVRRAASPEETGGLSRGAWVTLAGVGVVMVVARTAWPDGAASPWRAARPPDPQQETDIVFDGQVRLAGFDVADGSWRADEELRVDTYWVRVAEMSRNTQVALVVLDGRGVLWSQKGGARPRGYESPPLPTFAWPVETFATDSQLIGLLSGTPPGDYTLAVTLFDRETLKPLVAPGAEGGVTAQAPLGTIRVTWPGSPPDVEALGIQHEVGEPVGGMRLLGYNLDREEVAPGEMVLVTLFWQSEERQASLPEVTLDLSGEVVAIGEPGRVGEPVPAGMAWREQYPVTVPAGTDAGAGVIGLRAGDGTRHSLGSIRVKAVERTFEQPDVAQTVDALFGGVVRLVGVTVEAGEDGLGVELVWGAEAEIGASYTVFVHALDAEGNIVAQSDSIPAGGARPTSGWLPGEYVIDAHRLAVEAGEVAALRVGLYDAGTGIRVGVDDGGDAVVIALP